MTPSPETKLSQLRRLMAGGQHFAALQRALVMQIGEGFFRRHVGAAAGALGIVLALPV